MEETNTSTNAFMDAWMKNDLKNPAISKSFFKSLSAFKGPSKALLKKQDIHNDFIGGLIIHQDYLISSSEDYTIKIHNKNTLELIHEIGFDDPVNNLALAPNKKYLAAGCDDYSVKVIELDSWKILHNFEGHENYVSKVAFSGNDRLVSASKDGLVGLWNLKTGKNISFLEGHKEWVYALATHPSKNQVLVGAMNSSLKLWDLDKQKSIKDVLKGSALHYIMGMTIGGNNNSGKGNLKSLQTACWLSDELVCTVANDIVVWNATNWEPLWQSEELSKSIKGLAYYAEKDIIITGSASIDGWDAKTGKRLFSQLAHEGKEIYSLCLNDDKIYTCSEKGELKIWNLDQILKEGNKIQHSWGFSDIIVDEKTGRSISGSYDKTAIVWDKQGEVLKHYNNFGSDTSCLGPMPNHPDQYLIASDGSLTIININSLEILQTIKMDNGLYCPEDVFWINDEMLITCTLSYRPRLINTKTGAISVLETPCSFTSHKQLSDELVLFTTYVGGPIDIDNFEEDEDDDEEQEEGKIKAELMSIGMLAKSDKYEKTSPLIVFNFKTMKVVKELWHKNKHQIRSASWYPDSVLKIEKDALFVRYSGSHILKWDLKTDTAKELHIYDKENYGMGFFLEKDVLLFGDGKSLMIYELNLQTEKLALWEGPGLDKRNFVASSGNKYLFYTVGKILYALDVKKRKLIFQEELSIEIDELQATKNKLYLGSKGGEIMIFSF